MVDADPGGADLGADDGLGLPGHRGRRDAARLRCAAGRRRRGPHVRQGLGLLALAAAAWLVGAASGGATCCSPGHLAAGGAAATPGAASAGEAHFKRVRTIAELDAALAQSRQPVMLDFYADWCVSCREMERFTFTDPGVAQRMGQMLLLQADVTANNADDRALLKRFRLFGPPGIMFFEPGGRSCRMRASWASRMPSASLNRWIAC